jgi:peptidoglycan glycosyltransferase
MVSVPGFDPNAAKSDAEFEQVSNQPGSPTFNRPVQAIYPPGSTMKVVTAAAALDSGEFQPDTVLNADSPKQISGVALENSGGQSFGDIDMTTALTNSVNTYWAQVGEQLGTDTMVEYMERFGFYADPELDYPEDQMRASGVYSEDKLVKSDFDVGRVAIGQGGAEGQILATATQMAEVAATVANGGTLMEPTFLQAAQDPDGRTIEELDGGDEQGRVISEETAAQLVEMMTNVTREGTASALSVDGVEFAGKTGTAEIDLEGTNQPWFIMFAPSQDPQIAIAATVERCQGCFGGEVPGPIATAVAESLLDG